jgi:chaperonin GroES
LPAIFAAALTRASLAPICPISRWHSLDVSANSGETFEKEEGNMAFRPLHDRVLVRRVEAESKTAGGIIIPDSAKEKPQEGEVVAVGTGARADNGTVTPLEVKAGDRILFGKWSGTEVKLNGEDLLIMKESDILGIVG